MKPTRSRIYCRDSAKSKILFETEKKADNFIKFNADDIEAESGRRPIRSYFCISCGGFHVTSKKEDPGMKSRSELVLESYEKMKQLDRDARARMRKLRKERQELNKTI